MANSGTAQDKVELDLNISEVKYQRAEFAAVVFHNVAEYYPSDAHVECQYTITKDLIPSSRDWIGLYKVGWMSLNDYIYYEWAPYPENYETGKEAEGHVLFQSHRLPGDDGEFYQFCYVSSSAQVRGASMPFQFRKPHADDFVEIEDEETDMLVIRSKTVVLEESLRQAENEKVQLLTVKKSLESERDGLVDRLCMMEEDVTRLRDEAGNLQKNLKVGQAKIDQMDHEAADMLLVHDELKAKLEAVDKEQEEVLAHLTSIEKELDSTRTAMKKLQNEKDELEGMNRNLLEERELFKNQYTSTESSVKAHMLQIEDLHTQIAKSESLAMSLKEECAQLQKQVADQKTSLSEQVSALQSEQENVKSISLQLKNAEDKLEAAEENKSIIQNEMRTYEEIQKKMSTDLEEKEEKCRQLKHQIVKMEEAFIKETECLKSVISELEEQLDTSRQAQEKFDEEIVMLRDQLDQKQTNSETSLSSMYALKMAQDKLKERYTKLQDEYQEKLTEKTKRLKQARERERTLVRELEDMKEHLRMGKEEYKTLYIEKQKLQKKLDKLAGRKCSRVDRQSSSPEPVKIEKLQTSSDTSPGEKNNGTKNSTDNSQVVEMEQELDNLGKDYQQRMDKKQKYKKELQEERNRQETLRKHYYEDIQKREREVDRLRKKNEEVASGYEMKIRVLESFIVNKDKIIEELNQKLRDKVRLSDDPKTVVFSVPTTPQKTPPEVSRCPIFEQPRIMYPRIPMSPPQTAPPCSPQESFVNMPLIYPRHGQSGVNKLVYPDHEEIIQGNLEEIPDDSVSLHEPLTPLPAPIQPVVLPSAKYAAVKAVMSGSLSDDTEKEEDIGMFLETDVKVPLDDQADGPVIVPSAPPQHQTEERYMDAIGESMKLCPVCDMTFSADIPEKYFTEHVLGHAGRICPVCLKLVDEDMTEDDFARHVNEHLLNPVEQ